MKLLQLLAGACLLAFVSGEAMAEQPSTPPGEAVSTAARAGGSHATADVARQNAPGTTRSADARAANPPSADDDNDNDNDGDNNGIGGEVSAFAKDAQGEGVSDFVLENSPGIDKANDVHANLPTSVPAARPTLPSTARATLPTLPTRPTRPQLPTVPPRH